VNSNVIHSEQSPQRVLSLSSEEQFASNINNENLLNRKCTEISEDENTIIMLHRFVEEIERAMKIVSDKMMEQYRINDKHVAPYEIKLNNPEQTNEDPTETFRYREKSF
jgi:hypothetical protein